MRAQLFGSLNYSLQPAELASARVQGKSLLVEGPALNPNEVSGLGLKNQGFYSIVYPAPLCEQSGAGFR